MCYLHFKPALISLFPQLQHSVISALFYYPPPGEGKKGFKLLGLTVFILFILIYFYLTR